MTSGLERSAVITFYIVMRSELDARKEASAMSLAEVRPIPRVGFLFGLFDGKLQLLEYYAVESSTSLFEEAIFDQLVKNITLFSV